MNDIKTLKLIALINRIQENLDISKRLLIDNKSTIEKAQQNCIEYLYKIKKDLNLRLK